MGSEIIVCMEYLSVEIFDLEEPQRYRLIQELEELGSLGLEEKENSFIVYFEGKEHEPGILQVISDYTSAYEPAYLPGQNWNTVWESNFDPVYVGAFCYIKADFHPEEKGFEHTVRITPKMAFGTGHHATTFQVIRMMQHLDWKGKNVLDFGTGTGVLAILAERLGAAHVLAIDNDHWSVENALENVAKNSCRHTEVRLATIEATDTTRYDIIIANINRHILLAYMEDMNLRLVEGGLIIMSGILTEDEAMIISRAKECRLQLIDKTEKNNWLCLLMKKE